MYLIFLLGQIRRREILAGSESSLAHGSHVGLIQTCCLHDICQEAILPRTRMAEQSEVH